MGEAVGEMTSERRMNRALHARHHQAELRSLPRRLLKETKSHEPRQGCRGQPRLGCAASRSSIIFTWGCPSILGEDQRSSSPIARR